MKTFENYFEIIKFATPETNVRLKDSNVVPKCDDIIIKKCMNWEDFMHLICADDILTRNEIWVNWYVPYKPFARQDRVTAAGHANESSLMHQLIFDHLNGRMIFLDVHSDRYESGKNLHQFAPIKHYNPFDCSYFYNTNSWSANFHLIVPDAGAAKKIPGGVLSASLCEKKRDPVTGKLSGFSVQEIRTNYPMVLVDDICDGGGTFIGIAEHLQEYRKNTNLILYVSHGLFTKGLDTLFQYFDTIVTTNSVNDQNQYSEYISNGKLKVLDVLCDKFIQFGLKDANEMLSNNF